jgi:hypothetical protein
VLIGGFAVIAHGGARTTRDIDLLVDDSPENVARIRTALRILAARSMRSATRTCATTPLSASPTRSSSTSWDAPVA